MTPDSAQALAKVTWVDPESGDPREFVLVEGATATIGRLDENDICIREGHVSRQHAVINYQDGIFTLTDMGSANGTFVNDQKLDQAFPLAAGDVIRLFVPTLTFSAVATASDALAASEPATMISATKSFSSRLTITSGPQEGESIPLLTRRVMVGRAAPGSDWQVSLNDPSVSRPHARLELSEDNSWVVFDLGSANGTLVNGAALSEKGRALSDGDVVTFGSTIALFRQG